MSPLSKQRPGRFARRGRTTPKGNGRGPRPGKQSGRYTPPVPRRVRKSPKWMGALILGLLVVGALAIVLNYFDVLPASPTNWYLLGGIVLIASGFVVATQYH